MGGIIIRIDLRIGVLRLDGKHVQYGQYDCAVWQHVQYGQYLRGPTTTPPSGDVTARKIACELVWEWEDWELDAARTLAAPYA
jgi:hypothetical protein